MKKLNNPFLMIGSYIGLAIGLIGSYFSFAIILYLAEIGKFNFIAFFIPLVPAIVGFLLGYLIHLALRKISKK